MRVLFVSVGYPPHDVGGAERQAALQAEALTALGVDVSVVTARNGWKFHAGKVGSVDVLRIPRPRIRLVGRIVYLLGLSVFLFKRRRNVDIVHVHLANLQADVAVFWARRFKIPTHIKVASGGSSGEMSRLAGLAKLTRWYGLRNATSVQAISEEIFDSLDEIDVRPPRAIRIPNGVQLMRTGTDVTGNKARLRIQYGLEIDACVFAYVGRLATYKGIDLLLEAWHEAHLPESARLLLVGPQAVDRPIGDLPTSDGVVVLGPTDNPTDIYRLSDVFVLPSLAEGMSNAMLEAMAHGLPVIATSVGAAPELVGREAAGLLVPPSDVPALSDALTSMFFDVEARTNWGRGARERVEAFDIASISRQLAQRYSEMLGKY